MKLIGQEEVWENMKKSNAIPRAWAWFQAALAGLIGFVRQIPALFIDALKSLEITDLMLPPNAFAKSPASSAASSVQFITWAGKAVWNLLEIIFDVVSPGALMYIKKTGAALKSILKNPLPFVGNLVKAAKLGFQNFADNFLDAPQGRPDRLADRLAARHLHSEGVLADGDRQVRVLGAGPDLGEHPRQAGQGRRRDRPSRRWRPASTSS